MGRLVKTSKDYSEPTAETVTGECQEWIEGVPDVAACGESLREGLELELSVGRGWRM